MPDYSLKDASQRLTQYRKRYASHYQRKVQRELLGLPVSSRTLAAIENNRRWIAHYQALVSEIMLRVPTDRVGEGV